MDDILNLVKMEAGLGLHCAETFKSSAARIDQAKGQTLELIRSLSPQGKTIAGYGASATTSTLIYHFELGDKLTLIADDYPAKQNLYSSGHHIPVLAPQEINERKPDYILLLTWRYAEPIIEKQKAFIEQGANSSSVYRC